jgi:hypothetical protein
MVVVAAGPMQLGSGLPKLLILWVVDCPHTQECTRMQDPLRLILS